MCNELSRPVVVVGHRILCKSFGSGESVKVKIGSAVVKILVIQGEKKWFRIWFADEVEQKIVKCSACRPAEVGGVVRVERDPARYTLVTGYYNFIFSCY
jgi:hypothetical protein